MIFLNKKKFIEKIKKNKLLNQSLLRKTSIFADNELLSVQNVFVIKKIKDFKNHLFSKRNDNFFLENFSNYDVDFLKKNYDLVLVKIDFGIVKIITEKFEINKLDYNFLTPINIWVLKKGIVDFYELDKKETLSCYPVIINKSNN